MNKQEEQFTAAFRSALPVSGWPMQLYLLLTVLLQLNLALCLLHEWPDFASRLLTLKEINFSMFGLVGYLAVQDAHTLLNYADAHARRNSANSTIMTPHQKAVLDRRNQEVLRLGRTVEILFSSFQVFFGLTPFAALLMRALSSPHSSPTPTSPLPSVLHIYYPPLPSPSYTLPIHVLINMCSFYWYFMLVHLWKLHAKSLFVAFRCLVTDIELLSCTLTNVNVSVFVDEHHSTRRGEHALRRFLREAVADHVRICEDMKMLNEVSRKIVIGFMNIYGLQLCVYLVFVTMLDNWSMQLRYLFLYMVMLFIMYSISVNGQRVKDMGQTLRLSLWESQWTDKPEWFRKAILIMMTRATRDMIVRPYDLYTLDMNCITQIVRATYTYLNLAKNLN